ncbi:MAG: HK97 gp10 family phage protein [Sphingomonas bacterium]|nr:HK97 gp10 family phage protein [Sphingomonas bacterium]
MAKSTAFKFEGGKALQRALGELGKPATIRATAKRALNRAAEPIRDAWEAGVDVDSGDLKSAIRIGKGPRREEKRGNRGDRVTTFVGVDLSVNKRLSTYARIEEMGGHNEVANPAGRRAFETQRQPAVDRLARDLSEEIDKTATRSARRAERLAAKG